MNISKRDQKLLLILLGLVVFLISYMGVSRAFNNKQAAIQEQIAALVPQDEELKGYYSNLATYQSEIDRMESSVDVSLASYPSDIRSEDLIMYANELQNKVGISVQSISITEPEVISQFSIPKKNGDSSYELVPVAALRTGVSISCALNYDQFKKLIDYIYKSSKQTALVNVSVNYSAETGGLLGNVAIEKYFIASSDYTYSPTNIPKIDSGTTDPFGTLSETTTTPNTAVN